MAKITGKVVGWVVVDRADGYIANDCVDGRRDAERDARKRNEDRGPLARRDVFRAAAVVLPAKPRRVSR